MHCLATAHSKPFPVTADLCILPELANTAMPSLAEGHPSEFALGQLAEKPRPALAWRVLMKCGPGTEKLTCLIDREAEPCPEGSDLFPFCGEDMGGCGERGV